MEVVIATSNGEIKSQKIPNGVDLIVKTIKLYKLIKH